MRPTKLEDFHERTERSCDVLVLAYNPEKIIGRDFGRNFYIPGCSRVEEAFGFSLRKILGQKEGCSHWADCVKWGSIANLDKLEKRIYEGTSEVIIGDSDYQTIFESYLSSTWGKFDSTWIYGKGSLYRFREGKREIALKKFEDYWSEKEKTRWKQIQKFMREYSLRKFGAK